MTHPPAPLRPVSDEHRHEPADYELEPNELAAELRRLTPAWTWTDKVGDGRRAYAVSDELMNRILTALTQAPRSCCADERERCAKIADERAETIRSISKMGLPVAPSPIISEDRARVADDIATAIRSNSHD